MKLFRELREILLWARILPRDESREENFLSIGLICYYYVHLIFSFITTIWFFSFEARTNSEYVRSIFFVGVYAFLLFSYSVFTWKRKYYNLGEEISSIIEKRNLDPVKKIIYEKSLRRIDVATKFFFKLTFKIVTPIFMIVPVGLSCFWYISLGYNNESFVQVYPATYPFNWRTPIGYLAVIIIQTTTFIIGSLMAMMFISSVGYCMLSIDLTSDLKECVREIGDGLASMKKLNRQRRTRVQIQMTQKFVEFVDFYSEAREFVKSFSAINQPFALGYFLFVIVSLCALFLQINTIFETGSSAFILQVLFALLYIVFLLFAICYTGQQVTNGFDDIADLLYQIDWYRLPMNIQKYMPMILAVSQKKVRIAAFGSIRCNFLTFRAIIDKVYSFYAVFRELQL